MQAYRAETALEQNGKLALKNLPFQAGEVVEIIILSRAETAVKTQSFSLRGTPVRYE